MSDFRTALLIISAMSVLLSIPAFADDCVVVFNEVMYNPHVNTDPEWIELYNLFSIDVDISKWSLKGGIKYTFPIGTIVPANGYIVVTDLPDILGMVVNPGQIFGPFTGNLSNSGEQVRLYNNDNRIMDTIDYKDSGKWPVAPDGSGVTLAKRKPVSASNSGNNWTWSHQVSGTPGEINFPGDEDTSSRYNLVDFYDDWRYDDSVSNRGTLWRYLGYNDSAWKYDTASFYSGQDVTGDEPVEITTIYSTGCGNDRAVLSPGQEDPHYFITSSGTPLTVMLNHPAWIANDSTSMWIGLSSQGTDNQAGGDYSFSTTFDLSGYIPETAEISFFVAVDNELLDVKINGVSTGITSIGHEAFSGPFLINSGFISGENQIDFIFQNWTSSPNPMGLRINISGTAIPVFGNTEVNQGPVTHYFRKTFEYGGDPQSTINLDINHLLDDGAVFYLNGKEVYRYNMPEGNINYLTPALNNITDPHTSGYISVPVTNMTTSNNLLAVEVHQSGEDDDVLFDASVDATENPPSTVELINLAFNELSGAVESQFKLELFSYNEKTIGLTGYIIACTGTTEGQYVFTEGSIDPGDYIVLDDTILGFKPSDEDRLFLYSPDRSSLLDAAVVKNSHRGRYPEGTGAWQYPDSQTFGSHNSFEFNKDLVINEIMYNHSYVQGQEAQFNTNVIIQAGTEAKAFVPGDDTTGMLWTGGNEPFDDSTWDAGIGSSTGIGYETGSGSDYVPWIGTDVHDDMYGINQSVYIRIPFNVSDLEGINELILKILYDDAFIAYINGRQVARSSFAPDIARWNSGSDESHEAVNYESFDITEYRDFLVEGDNILAIHGFNYGLTSSDMIILPELEAKQLISPASEAGESDEEWIELYNSGSTSIDLSGWKIEGEIEFEFPDNTMIDGGEYIVIANNPAGLAIKYPEIRIIGEYDGRLSNKTGLIRLVDHNKNIADQVQYYDSYPWSDHADGRNASLELMDPKADNSNYMVWKESDESQRSSWNTYTYRQTAVSSPIGPDGQWQEFIMGLLDTGEILIDDISLLEDPDGSSVQLIQNGSFESGSAEKWRLLGNHSHSEVIIDPGNPANHVLRFIATGTTGHLHNHAETTLANGQTIINGTEYEISFRAKWIKGSNQLNSRLYFNRTAKTTLIDVPEYNGTPGYQNSRYQANTGPTFTDLIHDPAVPYTGQTVNVSVSAKDPDGISGVGLFWRVDQQEWNSMPMIMNSEGKYSAQLPALSTSKVVQFYVQGTDGLGNLSTFPLNGPGSRALYKVNDDMDSVNGLNNFRIIMLTDDYNRLHTNINLMSDDRIGATVIYNEKEIYYNTGLRLKSSQRHRYEAENVGFNVRFPADNLFCDTHQTVAIDRSQGVTPGQREMLIHITMNRAGSCRLTKYSDLIKVIAPVTQHTGFAELQLARYNSVFLDDQFEDGSDGEVYEYEYIYYPLTTLSGNPEDYKLPVPDGVTGQTIRDFGDNKENYRWQFLKKNNRLEDDYRGLICFAKDFGTTGTYFDNRISEIADVDQWLRAFAIAVACGAGDSYGGDNSQHNMQIYIRPSDGRALYFPHDLDAFYSSTRPLVANSDLGKIITSAGYERLYYGHVYDILNTSYNTAYMQHWTTQLGQLLPSQPFGSYLSFIGQRNSFLSGEIAQRVAPAYTFEITDYPSASAGSYAVISGKAWIDVKEVYLQGYDSPLELSWTSSGSGTGKVFYWNTSVPLEPGVNELVLLVYDFQGDIITTETISITSTVVERPLRDHLKITEIMYNSIGGSDYEFIELHNNGPDTLDISNLKMLAGDTLMFDFAISTIKSIDPDQYVLIVNDLAAFSERYYTSEMNIAGEYSSKLSNGGETLTFTGAFGFPVMSFEYNDSRGWPLAGDGAGHSIVPLNEAVNSQAAGSLNYGGNWKDSTYINGSPGIKDPDRPVTLAINEIMAHTDYYNPSLPEYDSNDWIELYNLSSDPVHIAENQWFLSDDTDNLKKWALPEATIAPGAFLSFDEVTGFHNPITQGFGLDKAGEQLFLSYLPGSSDDRVVDCIRFKAQLNDISLGRYHDGSNFWYKMSPSRDSDNNAPLDHVVISEVMYSPQEGSFEYIELYNPTKKQISLWDQETGSGWRLDGGIDYMFLQDCTIPAMGYLVLVPFEANEANLSLFTNTYGNLPSKVTGPYDGSLSNGGERVALEKPQASDIPDQLNSWSIVDEVIYFNQEPWPNGANETGMAIRRFKIDSNGNDPSAWLLSYPKPGTMTFDFDADGDVDIADWTYLAGYWMTEASDQNWNPQANLDGQESDIIDWNDMLILLEYWLWTNK